MVLASRKRHVYGSESNPPVTKSMTPTKFTTVQLPKQIWKIENYQVLAICVQDAPCNGHVSYSHTFDVKTSDESVSTWRIKAFMSPTYAIDPDLCHCSDRCRCSYSCECSKCGETKQALWFSLDLVRGENPPNVSFQLKTKMASCFGFYRTIESTPKLSLHNCSDRKLGVVILQNMDLKIEVKFEEIVRV
jgi:hypothetical protein